jgi:heat shock factor-binding protein 1
MDGGAGAGAAAVAAPAAADPEQLSQFVSPALAAATRGARARTRLRPGRRCHGSLRELNAPPLSLPLASTCPPARQVANLMAEMQSRFQTMSDAIIGRIDEMGSRIDELERSIGELVSNTAAATAAAGGAGAGSAPASATGGPAA